jgi:hypothetical protein
MKNKIESVLFGGIILIIVMLVVLAIGFTSTYLLGFELQQIEGRSYSAMDEVYSRLVIGLMFFAAVKGVFDLFNIYKYAVKFYMDKEV